MTATPPPAAEAELLRLDRQICFSLHAASRAFNGVYRVLLKDLGLTYPQYLVMLVLWEQGELPVKKLGEHLRLDSGTLSPLVKRLEAAGLVRRERSTRDERSVQVGLTAQGAALRDRALEVPRSIAAATGFGPEEIGELRERLDLLTTALDSAALTVTAVAPSAPSPAAPAPGPDPDRSAPLPAAPEQDREPDRAAPEEGRGCR